MTTNTLTLHAAALTLTAFLALCVVFAAHPALAQAPACHNCADVEDFYEARGGALAWTGRANSQNYVELLAAIETAESHGLRRAVYHYDYLAGFNPRQPNAELDRAATDAYLILASHLLSGALDPVSIEPDWTAARHEHDLLAHLTSALQQGAVAESIQALAPDQSEYQALRGALEVYRGVAAEGGWPAISPGETMRPGDRGPRVRELRERLAATGDVILESDDPDLFDERLEAAVRQFQHRTNLDNDGVVGMHSFAQLNVTAAERVAQIEANMERWRWLPEDLGRRHIRVNIADFSLEARNGGVVEQVHDVIVGRLYRKTPVFSGNITYFVLNPWWETPPSIAARDKLPAFRQDPSAVERLGFQVIDRDGTLVDPATIDWESTSASNFPYRLRQAPGPMNALGEVKFMFPNRHNVYIHDTPTRGLFARNRRDFSSGCIRVADPLGLAEWVASETPSFTLDQLRAAAAGDAETTVSLSQSIPVHILYWTVVPDDVTGVRFVDDLYSRDQRVIEALASL